MLTELADFPSESDLPLQHRDEPLPVSRRKSANRVTFEFVRPEWPERSVIGHPSRPSRRHVNAPISRMWVTRAVATLDALDVRITALTARCLEHIKARPVSSQDAPRVLGTCAAIVASWFITGWLIDIAYPVTTPDARPVVLPIADIARTPPPPPMNVSENLPPQRLTTSARRRGAPIGRFVGALSIRSVPSGAWVWVDQTPIGPTPLVGIQMRAGSHAIRIEHAGFHRWSAAVHVPADKRTEVAATLDAVPAEGRVSR
jgi:hypothetical protein